MQSKQRKAAERTLRTTTVGLLASKTVLKDCQKGHIWDTLSGKLRITHANFENGRVQREK